MTSGGANGVPSGSGPGGGARATPVPPLGQDFETFYHSVCSDLQNRGEVHSMSKLFATLGGDEERLKFVLERNFGGGNPPGGGGLASWGSWRDFNFSHKDRAESQRLRNLGNQVYQKNKLPEALEYYSQSICYAPHPPPPNSFLLHGGGMMGMQNEADDGGFTHEELALGYANRSAVLFQVRSSISCGT